MVLLLFACFESRTATKTELFVIENMEASNFSIFIEGLNLKSFIDERFQSMIYNNKSKLKVYDQLEKAVNRVDSISNEVLLLIESTKAQILIENEIDTTSGKYKIVQSPFPKTNYIQPSQVQWGKLLKNGRTNLLAPSSNFGLKIRKLFNSCRTETCKEIISSYNYMWDNEKTYVFNDVNDYSKHSIKQEVALWKRIVANSSMPIDEEYALREVYFNMYHYNSFWSEILQGDLHWTTAIQTLLALENEVLMLKQKSFNGINMRWTFCNDYGFNQMFVMTNGGDVVQDGDTISFDLAVGAFNRQRNPYVTIDQVPFKFKVKNGVATVKIPPSSITKDSMTIKGTVILKNINNVIRKYPWQKTIKIVK